MQRRKLTSADVCNVSGYSRDQLRRLLEELPGFASPVSPRVAREFSSQDLIVISIIFDLENRLGIRRASIGNIVDQLKVALTGPRTANREAQLRLVFIPPTVDYLQASSPLTGDGVLLSLAPIFDRVDSYLSPDEPQRALEFRWQVLADDKKIGGKAK